MILIKEISGNKHDKLFVFFSGMQIQNQQLFQFLETGTQLDYDSIYIMDTENSWYSTGFNEASTNLKHILKQYKNSKIIFVGSSMGGYAALKFGIEMPHLPDKIIAFSPQVSTPFYIIDLPSLYETAKLMPEIDIHLCSKTTDAKWDDMQAAYQMENYTNIIVHDCNTHNCVRLLKDENKLMEILENA